MPLIGEKQRMYCKKCGEPTTQLFKEIDQGVKGWVCLSCESGAKRSKEKLDKIKKTRKGWKTNF